MDSLRDVMILFPSSSGHCVGDNSCCQCSGNVEKMYRKGAPRRLKVGDHVNGILGRTGSLKQLRSSFVCKLAGRFKKHCRSAICHSFYA